ncbi:MAG: penicillin-binding transpeptidase domain-containing protein, partial [Clostridia bacterium]|nr:penicillin-binding transpeptidase domain-containing protein [Clostridia bacterium]
GLDLSEDDGLSIALGGLKYGVSPVQMTSAYMTFANGGNYKNAVFVKEIKDKNGKPVYKHTPDENRVITRETAYLVTDMLMDTAKSGTARKLASLPFDIASKTGTVGVNGSDKNSDAWNMSYTSQNTVCVWYGSISNEPDTLLAKNITGGAYPTLVAKYMHRNLGNPTAFEIPDTIVPIEIDTYATENEHRLIVAGEYTPQKYKVWEVYDSKMELPEVSTYFDNAIPKDLKSNVTEDNKIEIYFSLNANFNYNLYKIGENGDTLLGNYSGLDEGTFLDETPELGVNSYYFTVTDTNGELIGESDRTSVLYFSVPDLLFSSRHPPTLLQ